MARLMKVHRPNFNGRLTLSYRNFKNAFAILIDEPNTIAFDLLHICRDRMARFHV